MKLETKGLFKKYDKFDPETGVQLCWDPSSLDLAMTCPEKYRLSRLMNWRIDSTSANINLNWGILFHLGCEEYHKALFAGKDHTDAITAALKSVQLHTELLVVPEGTKGSNNRTLKTLVRALVWYADHYVDDTLRTATLPNGEPALEIRYEVPFPGTNGKRLSGRIDRLVEFDGLLYISDTKTTGNQLTSNYFRKFEMANATKAYIWALRTQMGLPVRGFIVDGVRALVGSNEFGRQTFPVSDSLLKEWTLDAAETMNRFDEYAKTRYPHNWASCYANGRCFYTDVCGKGPKKRQAVLNEFFTDAERSI